MAKNLTSLRVFNSATATQTLRQLVEGYHFDMNGVQFWTPYWINKNTSLNGPFKGKGSPGQIRASLQRRLDHPLETGEAYRQFMSQIGLGVDCSGFVYYVLDQYLRRHYSTTLANQIIFPKAYILALYDQKQSWRDGASRGEIEQQPDSIKLSWIASNLHKTPAMITSSSRLVDPQIVSRISRAQDVRPADLIKLITQKDGDHIGIVVEITADEIIYAQSTQPDNQLGGVEFTTIKVNNWLADLDAQTWKSEEAYHPGSGSNDGVWRLNVLQSPNSFNR